MDEELIVSCRHLGRVYDQGAVQVTALKAVDLDIERGAFDTLCGPSGSGKTTLLNIIGGLDSPDSGEVTVAGRALQTMTSGALAEFRLRNIGFVFQAYNLLPVLSACENVEFILQLQGVSLQERRARSYEILEAVGLKGMERRLPGELSGGQQQRVAVARAIVSNPTIVLADEPTANLDSNTSKSLLELMRKMNAERGTTFLFSTHDPLVMSYAKRRIRLKDGEIEKIEVS